MYYIYNADIQDGTNIEGYNYFIILYQPDNSVKYMPLLNEERQLSENIKNELNKCELKIHKTKINEITKYTIAYNGHHLLTVSYLKKMHYNIYKIVKEYTLQDFQVVHYFDKYWLEETANLEYIGADSKEQAEMILDKINAALLLEDLSGKEVNI